MSRKLHPGGNHNKEKQFKRDCLREIHKFLEHLELSGSYSVHTLSAYQQDLILYSQFLKEKQINNDFYEYMDRHSLSARSKARVISSVRSYFRFLEKKGYSTANILLKKLHTVPVKARLPRLVSLKEFNKIYQASQVKDGHKTARNQITLLLLFGLGCRISEIIQLNLQDISELDQSLVVTGKRKKQRLLPLTNDLFKQLTQYIQHHRLPITSTVNTHSLLLNNKGRRPSRVDIWRWLASWSKKAGLSEIKGPHQFRHGFATGLLENGADLRSIQFLLGHSNIQTTQIYTAVRQKHLKKTIDKHHPLSAFKNK